jgi:phosphonate transport system ATP-binding protein
LLQLKIDWALGDCYTKSTIYCHTSGPQTPNSEGFELLILSHCWGAGGGSSGIRDHTIVDQLTGIFISINRLMNHSRSLFELQNVSHAFGSDWSRPPDWALQQVNLTIAPGELVALVGSSGAGKSTLLQILNATLQPTSGDVTIFDHAVKGLNQRSLRSLQRQIGMIDQQFNLVNQLRVIHNVNAGHLGRWPWWRALFSLFVPLQRSMAVQALTQVGIPEKIDERTDQLSGGQQQRVAIARVLVQDPVVVLADEPTASLDPELRQEVMALLCQLCQQRGRALVVSLHDVVLAQQYCDRMIGLRQGRIWFDLPTVDVTPELLSQLYDRHDRHAYV